MEGTLQNNCDGRCAIFLSNVINIARLLATFKFQMQISKCGNLAHPVDDKWYRARSTYRVDVRIPDVLQVVGDVEITLHVGAGSGTTASDSHQEKTPRKTRTEHKLSLCLKLR